MNVPPAPGVATTEPGAERAALRDRRLVHRLRRGDMDALHQVYHRYKDDLLTVAMSLLNDRYAAEDCVHDVFVHFAAAPADLRATKSLQRAILCAAWRIGRRTSSRGTSCSPYRLATNRTVAEDCDCPTQRLIASEESTRVFEALAQLPAEQREVIALHIHGTTDVSRDRRSIGSLDQHGPEPLSLWHREAENPSVTDDRYEVLQDKWNRSSGRLACGRTRRPTNDILGDARAALAATHEQPTAGPRAGSCLLENDYGKQNHEIFRRCYDHPRRIPRAPEPLRPARRRSGRRGPETQRDAHRDAQGETRRSGVPARTNPSSRARPGNTSRQTSDSWRSNTIRTVLSCTGPTSSRKAQIDSRVPADQEVHQASCARTHL